MKLQKQRTRKDKDYSKYVLTISKNIIKESGFKEGDELEAEVKKGEIKLRKK